MSFNIPPLGILQGRLTPSPDGSIQFFPKDNWQNEFQVAGEIGFDCMELLVKRDSWSVNPLLVSGGSIVDIGELATNAKLYISSVHAFYDKSKEYPDVLRSIIYKSAFLGAETVLVSFFNQNTLVSKESKCKAYLQFSSVEADCITGVKLGIEAELPALELLEFVRLLSNLGVYYDIGNMASMGVDVVEEIKLLGNFICGVHVKDRLANGGKTVPLGEGCADFEGAFRALCQVGYRGPFIIQGARVAGVDDIELNRRYFHFCKDLLLKTYGGGGR